MLLHSFWNSARPNTASFHIPVNKPWAKPRTKRGKYTWAQTLKDSDLSACDAAMLPAGTQLAQPFTLSKRRMRFQKKANTHTKREAPDT